MSSAVPPLPPERRPYEIVEPPHSTASATVTVPNPNDLAGFGPKIGPWAQLGIGGALAGAMLGFFYMVLSSQLHQNQAQHSDTMQLIIRTLDRAESNQQSNQLQFTAMQTEMRQRIADSDRKHEDLVKEIKIAAKDHTDAITKTADAINKMLAKMPPDK